MNERKQFYNTAEVAEILGLTRAAVRRKAHDAGIGTMLNERAMLFTWEDIEALKALPDGRGKWQQNGGKKRQLEEKAKGTFAPKKDRRALSLPEARAKGASLP